MDTQTQAPAITIRETTLFDVYCHALESGEFTQIRGQSFGPNNGRCALGVVASILWRAGLDIFGGAGDPCRAIHPEFERISRRVGALLGCDGLASANDAGHSFTLLAAALRRARIEVEAGL